VGASGIDLFAVAGVASAADRRDVLLLRAVGEALDALAGPDFAAAFGGSRDQDDYRWGKLHRLVLDHPLDGPFSVPPAFGRFPQPLPDLPGISTDGGFSTVDAASPWYLNLLPMWLTDDSFPSTSSTAERRPVAPRCPGG
jgi:penicillin amidase